MASYFDVHSHMILSHILTEKPGKPDAPEITKLGKTSASLSWKPPRQDGGAEITNYVIEHRVEGGFKWVKTTETILITQYTLKGLVEGNVYEFRVAAENKAGVGPASDPTMPVTVKEPISK
jgi:titin